MVCAMRIFQVRRGAASRNPRAWLADEAGSFLIEAMVSAVVLLIAGAGVHKMLDRGSELTGQQKRLATAGTLAQSEQETLRSYALSKEGLRVLSNLRRATPRDVAGTRYSITSRTDWINDDSGDPSCTTAEAADYMKVTTAVTFPTIGNRNPVTLESLITPPARAFDPDQGSLAVQVDDGSGDPISGLTLSLTGPATLSDATNVNGCVLWGYIPAGSGYTISASRSGYVQPSGSATIAEPASVIGDQTANVDLQYDRAGGVRAQFTTKRTSTATPTATKPQSAMVEHPNASFIPRAFTLTGSPASSLDTGLVLFPFAAPYTIYADRCASSKPPPANLVSAVAPAGSSSSVVTVPIPGLNFRVRNGSAKEASAVVKVTSPCGTVYTRSTLSDGTVDDPGFPYGNLAICVSKGGRKLVTASVANTSFTGTGLIDYDIGTSNSSATNGAC